MPKKRICLRLNANVARYRVTVYDGCERYTQTVYNGQDCLCLCASGRHLRVAATSLTEGYAATTYAWVDTSCRCAANLYFNFPPSAGAPTTALNTFTLTDRNYGLPIDGSLLFTAV